MSGGSALEGATPLLVVGSEQVAVTRMAGLLSAFPQICMTDESSVFSMLASDIEGSRVGHKQAGLYGKEYHELWSLHLRENARELLEGYYARVARSKGLSSLRYWGDASPYYLSCLEFIAVLYPLARFVNVLPAERAATAGESVVCGADVIPAKVDAQLSRLRSAGRLLDVGFSQLHRSPDKLRATLASWLDLSLEHGQAPASGRSTGPGLT